MPFNGAGQFLRIFSWIADKAAGLDISSSRMDADTNDLAVNGFGNCLTRDGQGQPTANLPMAGFRHTGAMDAVNPQDYATLAQLRAPTTGAAQLASSAMGFNMPVNLGLTASVGSNILTVAIKGADGNNLSATNPVWIPFRDSTIANGDPVWVELTAALSISTFAAGATLGSTNGTPFRLWLVAFNNAGTVVLALINCSGGGNIFCPQETALASSTAMSGTATSSSVYYTPNGTTLTNKALRILGYVEYAAGLATAGTYGIAPTTVQLFGPGVKKPGDTVQVVYGLTTSNTITTTQGLATNMNVGAASVSPTSPVNWMEVEIAFAWQANNNGAATFIISRGTAPSSVGVSMPLIGNGSGGGGGLTMKAFDQATTAARASYNLFCTLTSVSTTTQMQVTGSQATIVTEIMG